MFFVGLRLWQNHDSSAPPAPHVVAQNTAKSTNQQTKSPRLPVRHHAPDMKRQRLSTATIVDDRNAIQSDNNPINKNEARNSPPRHLAGTNDTHSSNSSRAIKDKGKVALSPGNEGHTKPTVTAKDSPTMAASSSSLKITTDQPESTANMREIKVVSQAISEEEPTEQRHLKQSGRRNADVAIIAALMRYLDTSDTTPDANSEAAIGPTFGNLVAVPTSQELNYPLRAKLQRCPSANTTEGIACRQRICKGHRGEAPACPAGAADSR